MHAEAAGTGLSCPNSVTAGAVPTLARPSAPAGNNRLFCPFAAHLRWCRAKTASCASSACFQSGDSCQDTR
jgi:hypothetical protein